MNGAGPRAQRRQRQAGAPETVLEALGRNPGIFPVARINVQRRFFGNRLAGIGRGLAERQSERRRNGGRTDKRLHERTSRVMTRMWLNA